MLKMLLSDDVIKMLAAGVGLLVPVLLRLILKDRADKAEHVFASGVEVAYHIVDEVSHMTPTEVDDKAALGLKYLSDYLKTHGQTLKPVDADRAKLVFKAMHGVEKASA